MTCATPSASAPSVPGRSCRCRSALAASCVRRGSTTTSLIPRSSASIRWPAAGVFAWNGLALQTSRQRVLPHVRAGHLAVEQLERHRGGREAGARLGAEVGRAVLQRQALHEGAQLLGVADVEDRRLGPALGPDALEVGGDLLERLVPRDRLELAGAARPGAPQRREQPVLVVDVLARRGALGAERAAVVRILARALDLDDAAVAHVEVEAALRRGIADRADRLAHLDAGVRAGELGPQPAFRVVHVIPSLTAASAAAALSGSRAAGSPGARPSAPQQRSGPAHVTQQVEAYQPPAGEAEHRDGVRPLLDVDRVRRGERSAAREQQLAGVLDVAGQRRRGTTPSRPAMVRPAVRPCRRALDHRATTTRSPLTGSSVRATSPAANSPGAAVRQRSSTSSAAAGREAAALEQAEVGARSRCRRRPGRRPPRRPRASPAGARRDARRRSPRPPA